MKKYYHLVKTLFFILLLAVMHGNAFSQRIQDNGSNSGLSVFRGGHSIPGHNLLTCNTEAGVPKVYTTLLSQDFSSTTFPPTGWTRSHSTGTMDWIRDTKLKWFSFIGTSGANGYACVNAIVLAARV